LAENLRKVSLQNHCPKISAQDRHIEKVLEMQSFNLIILAKVDAFAENIDILPTLLELFSVEVPRQCDGVSLLPFFRGEPVKGWRSEVHWAVDFGFIDDYPDV